MAYENTDQETACGDVNWSGPPQQTGWQAQGALIGRDCPEPYYGKMNEAQLAQKAAQERVIRAQQAVYVLEQARQIRADADLMLAVREHLRQQRDDMLLLLDDLGGG